MTVNEKHIWVVVSSFYWVTVAFGLNTPTVRWGKQPLTPTNDTIFGWMITDSNDGIYMAVLREPPNDSEPASTTQGFFLLKYNQDGDSLWTRQLGKSDTGEFLHVAVNGLAADSHDNVYVYGYTHSSLGQKNLGKNDVFIAKYDHTGSRQWVRQLGTPQHDVCTGLAVDANDHIYITGYTYGDFAKANAGTCDIFVAAYDPTGTCLWRDQFGTDADDRAMDLRLGNDNDLYLCATTAGSLGRDNNGQADIVVARYERNGKQLWVAQYGTPAEDNAVCMEIGEHGEVYVSGRTLGNLAFLKAQRGYGDAFTIRMSDTGEILWKRQYGSRGWDKTFHMARFMDGTGDILVGGCQYPSGVCQAFCRRYAADGRLVWTQEFRKRNMRGPGATCGRAVAVDSDNNCYHAGGTQADNWAINNGTRNIFFVRFNGTVEK
ncbi:SBBP repeat-containing protein [Planctomycetota bacterium]